MKHYLVFAALLQLCVRLSGADETKRKFDVPGGSARVTLKQFARQAGREIVFEPSTVAGVTTKAVHGEYVAADALGHMLEGTDLAASEDTGTGAFAVARKDPPVFQGPVPSGADPSGASRPMPTPAEVEAPRDAAQRPEDASTSLDIQARQPVQLSPFEVNADLDRGYAAANTLAGTRLNTSLSDTPGAISVFTKEFLSDIGALTSDSALMYALNSQRDYSEPTGAASVQQRRKSAGPSIRRRCASAVGTTIAARSI